MRHLDRFTEFTYVCKFCGDTLATYKGRSAEPVVLSVCDKRACRDEASAQYKASVYRMSR